MTTVVAFHAHPDDEVVLTGGTLAMLAATGHRVVIVVATDGIMWEGSDHRLAALRASASHLGAERVVHLGYADSGHGPLLFPDPPGRTRFARADPDEAAARLAAILREERAGLLLSYDAADGYGHRDHMMVHQVGARAARQAGQVRVLEATWPRLSLAGLATRSAATLNPRAAITHRVNVRTYAAQKRAALATHDYLFTGSGPKARLGRLFIRLPVPVFALLMGHEWFADPVRLAGDAYLRGRGPGRDRGGYPFRR